MLATSSVFKHDLEQFNIDFTEIKSIHCRNDNAWCYSGPSAIMAKKEICESVGIKLESIDFNEAQKGKDQCDSDGAVAKRKIRTYVKEGHDEKKRKEDPRNVYVMMRNAGDERGNKIFASSEYMRKEQIASFFSRLCSQKRKELPLRSEEE